MKKILITGASGFVGGFLVEEALKRNLEVHAGVRKTSSRAYLQDERIRFFEVDFSKVDWMTERLKNERFDYIIHNAGIVGAPKKEDYFRVNFEYTKHFVSAIQNTDNELNKFIYISSLAAFGPASNSDKKEVVRNEKTPLPFTTYGKSKLASEQFLQQLPHFPYLIFRPTAVYGPREKDLLTFFKIINRHLETYIGFEKQDLTFIFVRDLARVILDATLSSHTQKAYFVTDGKAYSAQDLGALTKQILNKKTLKLHVPIGLVRPIAFLTEAFGKLSNRFPTFNLEKVQELSSLNWKCDIEPLQRDFNFQPNYDLESGLRETLLWYQKHDWL